MLRKIETNVAERTKKVHLGLRKIGEAGVLKGEIIKFLANYAL